jgi:uncharacterized phage infection (PIP) family protein YhgE
MKKIGRVGGADPDEKVPLVVKPASDEATTATPIMEPVSDEAIATTTEPITEPVSEPVAEPATAPDFEPESAPTPTTDPEPAQMPEPEPAQMPEPEPAPEPEQAPAPTTAPTTEPETTQVDTIPTADAVPKQIDAENVKPESSAPPSVADALDIIANKIAKAVVKEMRENPTSDSYPNQDANVAVPLAVNAIVKQTQLAPE